ncbi:peptidoglycan DD-metalloendopeptidase family protein, partial [Acidobacteriota bacterium]
GIPFCEAQSMITASRDLYNLERLMPGQTYCLSTDTEGKLCSFQYRISKQERLTVLGKNQQYAARMVTIPTEQKTSVVSGQIRNSLFDAVGKAGEDTQLALMLADLFGWEIDFLRDVRRGDTFRVIVEKHYLPEGFHRYGRILAAEMMIDGTRHRALYYKLSPEREGYYHEDGSSVRRQFLKAPLAVTRVTSKFTHRRYHPILKRYRPHYGVDYGAPVGTPVRTVGDGRIVRCTRKRAEGKMVVIQHPNGYRTSYLHLSKFAKGIKPNKKVYQGQVIGYVGSTGLSTGPHLDFRIYKNGKPINPLTLRLPPAEALPAETINDFTKQAALLLELLDKAEVGKPILITCKLPRFDVY